ncbi:hypothetical protein [Desulfurivibrio dismutans]|uniref:hypothetical protein n=1 Tax=Desulfurivibrio dismutans TaxID=1398908 RepID=UPI0023DADD04|nr:hypothetical protein [Desulfurivibrio alkaliphilus]MDF1613661.1 hypothetical protein [Desulfurivibrio alkaliphilus]
MKKEWKRLKGTPIMIEMCTPTMQTLNGVYQWVRAHSPEGRIDRLRQWSAMVGGEAADLIDEAEALLEGDAGLPTELRDRFALLEEKAESLIILEASERNVKRDLGRQGGCSDGGKKGGAAKRETAINRDEVAKIALNLLENGKPRREIAGIIAGRKGVSSRYISKILNDAGL